MKRLKRFCVFSLIVIAIGFAFIPREAELRQAVIDIPKFSLKSEKEIRQLVPVLKKEWEGKTQFDIWDAWYMCQTFIDGPWEDRIVLKIISYGQTECRLEHNYFVIQIGTTSYDPNCYWNYSNGLIYKIFHEIGHATDPLADWTRTESSREEEKRAEETAKFLGRLFFEITGIQICE